MLAALIAFLQHTGLTFAVGAITLRYVVMTRSGLAVSERAPALRDAARYGLVGSAVVLLLAPIGAWIDARALAMPGEAIAPLLRTMLFDTDPGKAILMRIIWAAAAVMAFSVARFGKHRGWSAAAISCVFLAITTALAGHASTATAVLPARVAVVMHVLGAGAWIGTLATLWRIARKASDATLRMLFAAFHPVAIGAVVMLAVSGIFQAYEELDAVSQLFSTLWGRLLLVKLALLGAVLWFGYQNFRTGEQDVSDRPKLRARMQTELILALLVLAVTGVLTTTGID